MTKKLNKYLVPQKQNNYQPYLLDPKRTVFYTVLFIVIKLIVIGFALSIPEPALVAPDVLAFEQEKIVEMVNELRQEKQVPELTRNIKLYTSSQLRANDLAKEEYFNHISPQGKSLAYFIKQANYNYDVAGENLAMGYSDTKELFETWKQSPTHYSNLIDPEFDETGIAIQSGFYKNIPTIYLAQHFGAQKPTDSVKKATLPNANTLPIDQTQSSLSWQPTKNGLLIKVIIKMLNTLAPSNVEVKQYQIPLTKQAHNTYEGTIEIDQSPDEFFKVVLPGIVHAQAADGTALQSSLNWQAVKIVKPTGYEKYSMAKNRLSRQTNVFNFAQSIYLAFIGIFSIVLLATILVKYKQQNYKVIASSCLLIGLLVLLYLF
jgi:hypothetical protein